MRKFIMYILGAVFLAQFSFLPAQQKASNEEDQIKMIFETGFGALQKKDMPTFEAMHVQDESAVHIGVMKGDIYKGWSEAQKNYHEFMESPAEISNPKNVSLKVVGDAAWGVWTFTSSMPAEGRPMEYINRLTLIFEQQGGSWLISHSHVSIGLPRMPEK